ncbi:NAD-dependent succinate-semialdehyde dehydrogenase [Novosphingobium resinovorum]|uniref:Aldehyde dehydrogenase domain-containing protein n=1 Tax=Novosphingobium resinovorum TaxID=158500 RepID=A0A1D8A6N2_9SPHN|nr:NAD-dependent succinate-semialdehyde dehydrogenase [Novosphingobium resinovorum]AOR77773.1 hypothetical protein BES08_14175 [Novosphingobium resinovorum]
MYPRLALFIAGQEIDAGLPTRPVINPATGETVGDLPLAQAGDIERAAAAAAAAFGPWKSQTSLVRARVLQAISASIRNKQRDLAAILTTDQGKPLAEAEIEVGNAADAFEWMAEEGKRVYGRIIPSRLPGSDFAVLREPVGPVAAFAPWNFPVALSCRKIATSLAAGCPIVIKPDEETPGALVAIARLIHELDVPPGLVNLIFGDPEQVSSQLIADPRIRKISFTGSTSVGRRLAGLAAQQLKKITLELGGHAPVIVTNDVDVDRVVELSVAAKFRNAGQICMSPSRFIVDNSIKAEFVDKFAAAAAKLIVGNGADAQTRMGPLANTRRVAAVEALVEDAIAKGARHVTPHPQSGALPGPLFYPPVVLDDVPDTARMMHEEPFGPIAPIVGFDTLDEAIARANATEFGLSAYAFTNSMTAMRRIRDEVQAGTVSINSFAAAMAEGPFGGVKNSGIGSEMGTEGLADHFTSKAFLLLDHP